MSYWETKRVAITGGANLIGSHLVEHLLKENVGHLWVIDDLSAGKRENLPDGVELWNIDLRDPNKAKLALKNADTLFHLAAAHGGRAFVDTHDLETYDNFSIDATVFRTCAEVGVSKVVYMSSACAYDTSIQQDIDIDLKLSESLIDYKKPILPDNLYGWNKYLSEMGLNAYIQRGHFDGAIARGFTIYGRGVSMTHFVGAAIARTYIRQDPLVVFGTGEQKRNWTYVADTARGVALVAEKGNGGDVFNIGTDEANTPNSVYKILWEMFGWKPSKIEYRQNELVGTANRIADSQKARTLLGWMPEYTIRTGLQETVNWFTRKYTVEQVKDNFEKKLFER